MVSSLMSSSAGSIALRHPSRVSGHLQRTKAALKEAREVPFETQNADHWRDAFNRKILIAHECFLMHMAEARAAHCGDNDHRNHGDKVIILRELKGLQAQSRALSSFGIWEMVHLSERAKHLEMLVSAHEAHLDDCG